ncbi:YbaB/EbfC family nucleoid-associated protein [Nocardia australiensis]|uniref:YbaB/EbfC family nucleoid-associated protein n=1 Tax=Nocardia australiensis TaxID=2887191 RepID=UPI001D1551D4|nr:YbaB/EbfC family nucleoid-associated protein [Nocardia australiensis]
MNGIAQNDPQPHINALREQVDSMLSAFEQQRSGLADAQARIAAVTGEAWSEDNLVRVVCNVAGIPLEVHVEAAAFKRSTPEKLGRSIAEAAQAAAQAAAEKSQSVFGPIGDIANDMPDLSDLIPGAPSIKDLVASMLPTPTGQRNSPDPDRSPPSDEDEDMYYRNRSYLENRR